MSLVPPWRLGEVVRLGEILLRLVFAEDVLERQYVGRRLNVRGIEFVEFVDILEYLRELSAHALFFIRAEPDAREGGNFFDVK